MSKKTWKAGKAYPFKNCHKTLKINLEIICKEDKINRNKRGDNEDNERVKELGRQIDQMVYKLYDLTSEEIKIVEGEND